MMTSPFAYAQARLQARYGERPGAAVWEALHALVELPAVLEQARATSLRRWIENISVTTPPHEMERLLRAHLRALIMEVAHWLPASWRDAVRWTEALMDLPALAHLLRGGPALGWMRDEPSLRDLANAEPELRTRVLAQGALAPLSAVRDGETLADRWLAEWRRRWPAAPAREQAALEALVARVRTHTGTLSGEHGADVWVAREALVAQAALAFRRAFLSPVAAFAWLLLAALELERLRGELVLRAHFAPGVH